MPRVSVAAGSCIPGVNGDLETCCEAWHCSADTSFLCCTDVDKYPKLASRYGISGLPTLLLFKDGKPIDKFEVWSCHACSCLPPHTTKCAGVAHDI